MSELLQSGSVRDERAPQAVVLVGGKGTRLQALVGNRPKPMADVGGRPFLEWVLAGLRADGVRRVVLCIGHMGQVVRAHFGDGASLGLEIVYSEDPELLGTGGALRKAMPLFETDPVLVLNGDSYCEVSLVTFLAWHRARKAQGSLVLAHVEDTGRYGLVQVDNDGRVLRFEEKGDSTEPGWINAGVYLLSAGLIASIPTAISVSIEHEVFPLWVGHSLYGYPGSSRFLDIGTPESYARAGSFFSRDGTSLTGRERHNYPHRWLVARQGWRGSPFRPRTRRFKTVKTRNWQLSIFWAS